MTGRRDRKPSADSTEALIRQVQVSLFAQPAFGANTVAVTHERQANRQFRINRAIDIGKVMAQITQIEAAINVAQQVTGWDVIFNV
jgi:hypothetical protein